MSNFNRCKTCGEWDWLNSHECHPRWEVFIYGFGDEDDFQIAFGRDEESAAESYARRKHSDCDYPTFLEIMIRKPGDVTWKKYAVEVEMVPSFSIASA